MDGWMLADVGLAAELEDLQEISEDGSKDPVASSTATALAAIFIDPIPVASSATLPATHPPPPRHSSESQTWILCCRKSQNEITIKEKMFETDARKMQKDLISNNIESNLFSTELKYVFFKHGLYWKCKKILKNKNCVTLERSLI